MEEGTKEKGDKGEGRQRRRETKETGDKGEGRQRRRETKEKGGMEDLIQIPRVS
ncbi:MAG: hypothetical protein JNK20_10255 [Flavipsychrobacter sp.]|nr:hypothetical protein [Flavipsychrobacter sp.]